MLGFLSKPVEPRLTDKESETISQVMDQLLSFSANQAANLGICFKSWILTCAENLQPSVASSSDRSCPVSQEYRVTPALVSPSVK